MKQLNNNTLIELGKKYNFDGSKIKRILKPTKTTSNNTYTKEMLECNKEIEAIKQKYYKTYQVEVIDLENGTSKTKIIKGFLSRNPFDNDKYCIREFTTWSPSSEAKLEKTSTFLECIKQIDSK